MQDFVDNVSVPVEGPASHGKCAQAADDKLEKVQNSGIHQANSSNESDVEIDPYEGFLVYGGWMTNGGWMPWLRPWHLQIHGRVPDRRPHLGEHCLHRGRRPRHGILIADIDA